MSDRILRLQHVEVRVPDLELCTAYYTEVVGLIEVAHEEGRVFLKCWDEHEHHSVVLRQAPTYGLDHMSFKVAEQPDLDYYTERVEKAGIAVEEFTLPNGMRYYIRENHKPEKRAELREAAALGSQYGVSVITVRQALGSLEEEGLISRARCMAGHCAHIAGAGPTLTTVGDLLACGMLVARHLSW